MYFAKVQPKLSFATMAPFATVAYTSALPVEFINRLPACHDGCKIIAVNACTAFDTVAA
jgi:hypothetical protein